VQSFPFIFSFYDYSAYFTGILLLNVSCGLIRVYCRLSLLSVATSHHFKMLKDYLD
jgi:hypothetical protein